MYSRIPSPRDMDNFEAMNNFSINIYTIVPSPETQRPRSPETQRPPTPETLRPPSSSLQGIPRSTLERYAQIIGTNYLFGKPVAESLLKHSKG